VKMCAGLQSGTHPDIPDRSPYTILKHPVYDMHICTSIIQYKHIPVMSHGVTFQKKIIFKFRNVFRCSPLAAL